MNLSEQRVNEVIREAKRDIYKSKERLEKWLQDVNKKGIKGLSKNNSNELIRHIQDLYEGKNVSKERPGPRTPITLLPKITRLQRVYREFEKAGIKDTDKLNDRPEILEKVFKILGSSEEYQKEIKGLWSWKMRIEAKACKKSKKRIKLTDITENLYAAKKEPNFVYFLLEELLQVQPYFNPDEQIFNLFLFDTIIRGGIESQSILVQDVHFNKDYAELMIREEISKTYGRTIKLLLCSEGLKEYILRNKLKPTDYLFTFDASNYNKKLKKLFVKVFGDVMTKGGDPFSKISVYDFRHSGACHWRLGAYKTKIDALMYRGGWDNLSMLNYYTKKIGMQDSIEHSDLLVDIDKNELEKLKTQVEGIVDYLTNAAIGKTKVTPEKKEEVRQEIMRAMNYEKKSINK